jgi:hypothetical protein
MGPVVASAPAAIHAAAPVVWLAGLMSTASVRVPDVTLKICCLRACASRLPWCLRCLPALPAELPELKGVDLAAPMDMIAAFHERMEKRGRQAARRAGPDLAPALQLIATAAVPAVPCRSTLGMVCDIACATHSRL